MVMMRALRNPEQWRLFSVLMMSKLKLHVDLLMRMYGLQTSTHRVK
jgi:hypothetical protein